jgi:hypothetical protein
VHIGRQAAATIPRSEHQAGRVQMLTGLLTECTGNLAQIT